MRDGMKEQQQLQQEHWQQQLQQEHWQQQLASSSTTAVGACIWQQVSLQACCIAAVVSNKLRSNWESCSSSYKGCRATAVI